MRIENYVRSTIFEKIWSYEFSKAKDAIEENKKKYADKDPAILIDLDILDGYSQFTQHALKTGHECIMQLWIAGKAFAAALARSKSIEYLDGIAWSNMLTGLCYFVEGVDKKDAQNKKDLYLKAKDIWDECTAFITEDDYFHAHLQLKRAMLIEKCIEDESECQFKFLWATIDELGSLLSNAYTKLGRLSFHLGTETSLLKEVQVKYHYTNARHMAASGRGFHEIKTEMSKAIDLAKSINSIFFKASGLMYICVAIRRTVEGLVPLADTESRISELNTQFSDYVTQCATIAENYSLAAIKTRLKSEHDRMHRLLVAKNIE